MLSLSGISFRDKRMLSLLASLASFRSSTTSPCLLEAWLPHLTGPSQKTEGFEYTIGVGVVTTDPGHRMKQARIEIMAD